MAIGEQAPTARIGRFEVLRRLAAGGMAELFLARFVGPGGFEKRCVLKRILPQFATNEQFEQMFLNEARVAALLEHPNIAQIFELGRDDGGQLYIAMELVNGLNFRELLNVMQSRRIKMPGELAAYLITQVLEGLAYAHDFTMPDGRPMSLVHRDISPQNLLVSRDGLVKIVDFGIVKGASINGMTQTGFLKGKVPYMSPEQSVGDQIDRRSDLFSIGTVLYELIARERPFDGRTDVLILKAIFEEAPQPIEEHEPDCPEALLPILARTLAKRPHERYQNAQELLLDLTTLLRQAPTPIGRHTVADFVRKVLEPSASPFDASRVRIPGPRVLDRIGATATELAVAREEVRSEPTVSAFETEAVLTPTSEPAGPSFQEEELGAVSSLRLANRRALWKAGAVLLGSLVVACAAWAWLPRTAPGTARREAAPEQPLEALRGQKPANGSEDRLRHERTSAPVVSPAKPPAQEDRSAADYAGGRRSPGRRDPDPSEKPEPRRDSVAREARGPSSNSLILKTTPSRLSVYRGGRFLGKTPLRDLSLPMGESTLRLASKELGISKIVTVDNKRGINEVTFTIEKARLRVNTRPWSRVFVDGLDSGQTPVDIEIYEGTHTVRMINEAGQSLQRTIHAAADELVDVRSDFSPSIPSSALTHDSVSGDAREGSAPP